MISKQYFETTFSLATAQALQTWANNNLITPDDGDYGMKISYNNSTTMFAETAITGLTPGVETTVRIDVKDIYSNSFKIYINDDANDNSSALAELGYGLGIRTIIFTPTDDTAYIAIGENVGVQSTYSIVDNITTSMGSIENGTFESGDTTGWYAQNGGAILAIYPYVSEPIPPVDNDYLEPVDIPVYNSSEPTHVLITTSNGNESLLNDSSKRYFYVEPGDYRDGTSWLLHASGSAVDRRYLSLYNSNDKHPVQLAENELARFDIKITGDYWTVDRYYANGVGGVDTQGGYNVRIASGASYNIFNRMYMKDFGSCNIFDRCDYNTFQNSKLENQSDPGYDGSVGIQIAPWGVIDAQVIGTKVINCEFYNCNDGFQVARGPVSGNDKPYQYLDVQGTVVDSCRFWKDVPYMENAFDLKAGSDNPSNPMIITNNIMWGYTRHPDYVPGSYGAGESAIQVHVNVKNTMLKDNVVAESARAINAGDNSGTTGFTGAFEDSEVTGNVFFECGQGEYSERNPIAMSSNFNTNIDNNYIISTQENVREGYLYNNINGSTFDGNQVALPSNGSVEFYDHDSFPNSAEFQTGVDNTPQVVNTSWNDFTFLYDTFSASPQQKTWANILDPNGTIVSPV